MKAFAAAGEPGGGGDTHPYSHFHFTWPQRLEMEENSERSKAATQTEGVIIIITMIIVIKIIMLAWKVLYKAGLFMSACCLCLRHFIFAHNNWHLPGSLMLQGCVTSSAHLIHTNSCVRPVPEGQQGL